VEKQKNYQSSTNQKIVKIDTEPIVKNVEKSVEDYTTILRSWIQ